MKRQSQRLQFFILFMVDACAFALGTFLSVWLLRDVFGLLMPYGDAAMREYYLVLGFSFALAELFRQDGDGTLVGSVRKLVNSTGITSLIFGAVFAVLLVLFKSPVLDSRYLFVFVLCFGALLMLGFRFVYRRILLNKLGGDAASLIEIVTVPEYADQMLHDVQGTRSRKVIGVRVYGEGDGTEKAAGTAEPPRTFFRTQEELVELFTHEAVDEVLICLPNPQMEALSEAVLEIEAAGTTVHFYFPALGVHTDMEQSSGMIGSCPVITLTAKSHRAYQMLLKRLFDILLSTVGLILSAPIILITAIPLKLESKGPLFFSQTRIGLNGRPFRIYKLRSMYLDAEKRKQELLSENEMNGLMFKMENDPRITKVGRFIRKTSIDELPQLFNVLKGDMSLIGPRPPLTDEFSQYLARYKRRLSMRPGITGLWQVSGRNRVIDFEDVVRLDLEYIDHWSIRLDLKIFLKTVWVVLKCSGE